MKTTVEVADTPTVVTGGGGPFQPRPPVPQEEGVIVFDNPITETVETLGGGGRGIVPILPPPPDTGGDTAVPYIQPKPPTDGGCRGCGGDSGSGSGGNGGGSVTLPGTGTGNNLTGLQGANLDGLVAWVRERPLSWWLLVLAGGYAVKRLLSED